MRSATTSARHPGSRLIWTILATVALVAAGITGFVAWNARQMTQAQEEVWRLSMQTQLDGAVAQAVRWLREREDGAKAAASYPPIVSLYSRLRAQADQPASEQSRTLRDDIRNLLSVSLNRNGIVGYVFTARDGRVLADSAALAGQILDTAQERELLARTLTGPAHANITLPLNWPRAARFGHAGPVILASAAVRPPGADAEPGVLFLLIDPKAHFDDIFLRARIGQSGETYAVSPDGQFATPSRFDPSRRDLGLPVAETPQDRAASAMASAGSSAASAVLTLAASEIAKGQSGSNLEGYRDYRGVEVIGLWHWNAEHRFGVVTEVDTAEALASSRSILWQSALAIISTLLLTGVLLAGFAWWTRRINATQARLLAEQQRTAELAQASREAERVVQERDVQMRMLYDIFPGYLSIIDKQNRYLYINRALADLVGRDPQSVVGRPLSKVVDAPTAAALEAAFRLPPGEHVKVEIRTAGRNGRRVRYLESHRIVGPVNPDGSGVNFTYGFDVTHARRGQEFEVYRSTVMQMMAQRQPLPEVLDTIVIGLESMAVPSQCGVFMLDDTGQRWEQCQAPGLPPYFLEALKDCPIDRSHDACARAATSGERGLTFDIAADPRWGALRDEARRAGLGACWAEPLIGSGKRVLGVLAMFHGVPTRPDNLDFYMLGQASRLAALAIDHDRANQQLAQQQAELQEKQRQLQQTIDSMIDGFIRGRLDDTTDMVNNALVKMLGHASAESLLGRPTRDFYADPADRDHLISTIMADGHISNFRCRGRRADGTILWTEISALLVFDAHGQPSGIEAVIRDITQRIKFEKELEDARSAAEAAAEAKGSFLANMSHEIRTPMNAIIGLTELALRTSLTPRQQDYLGKVHVAAHSLLGILNDILDLSKIESGKLVLERIAFSLDDVLDGIATVLAVQVEERGLELLFARQPDVPTRLVGDPLRLSQVLTNLTNNAKKFTEKGDIVVSTTLAARTDSEVTLRFSVRDSGIGMTPEQMSRLFQPFSQADDSTTRRFGGTGLGLVISRQIVEMMGGRIWAESEAGRGSTFTFEARFLLADDLTQPARVHDDSLKGLHTLVVDDNPNAREILQTHLQQFAMRVETAESAESALEMIQQSAQADPYHLVLLDYRMPGMDGLTAARRIKREWNLPVVPRVILVTAASRLVREEEEGDLQDLDEILAKPVNASLLFNVVMSVFGRREAQTSRPLLAVGQLAMDALRPVQGARILLVEDKPINQQVATEILEQAGFVVEAAGDGAQALTMLAAQDYDIVLMDIQMPVMDGYTATARIRAQARWRNLPVLAMTANVMGEDRAKAFQAGMNDHIAKPIVPQDLFGKLLRWIPHAQRPLPEHYGRATPDAAHDPSGLPATLPGIDLPRALLSVAGNRTLLRKLLKEFIADHGDDVAILEAALAAGEHATAQRLAHTLKGVGGAMGATGVQQRAGALEAALRADRLDEATLIAKDLGQALETVLLGLKTWSSQAEQQEAPASVTDGRLDAQDLSRLMAELARKLEELDPESVDLAAVLADQFGPDTTAAKMLVEQAGQFDFDGALQSLRALEAFARE